MPPVAQCLPVRILNDYLGENNRLLLELFRYTGFS